MLNYVIWSEFSLEKSRSGEEQEIVDLWRKLRSNDRLLKSLEGTRPPRQTASALAGANT